jgi:PAS domain S-box-containing protein
MPLFLDPILVANLILCIIILTLSILSYIKTREIVILYIGAAFGLFGITHLTLILGLNNLESVLIFIRTMAYMIVIVGIFVTTRIITERLVTERKLIDSEENYRVLFESVLDAIFVLDKETGNILDANATATRMYGYSRDEFLQMRITDISTEPEQSLETIRQSTTTVPLRYHKRKNNEIFPVEVHTNTFDIHGQQRAVSSIRDISRRKKTEEALIQANKKLLIMNSVTRHDILNLLTAMKGYVELLQEEEVSPSMRRYLGSIENIGDTISKQIIFTRDYQEIGVNSPCWQNIRDLVGRAFSALAPDNLHMTEDLDNIEIFADPLLEKVFYNLIENTIRHGKTATEISFSYQKKNGEIVIIYEDNGIGVPYNEKEQIFKQDHGSHTGLGLFLSKEILGITGLSIKETGLPGKGVRFEIYVPANTCRFPGN